MRSRVCCTVIALAFVACKGDGPTIPPAQSGLPGVDAPSITAKGPGTFTFAPFDTAQIPVISPLGQLGPPGHVLPTDHIYIHFVNPFGNPFANDCSKRPVYAVGSGVVNFMIQPAGTDWKVGVEMTRTFMYYFDHIYPMPGTTVGTVITAGQQIGTTNGFCPSIDLGVVDLDVVLPGLLTPERYGSTRYTGAPLKYFIEPLRSALYRRVDRAPGDPNRDGKIDYGVRGRLVGDWFLSTLPKTYESAGPNGWSQSLAFVYDNVNPSIIRVSIGGTLPIGLWSVEGNTPDPVSVSVATGKVVYKLIPYGGNSQPGMLAVQMIADDRIRIEVFLGSTAMNPAFTANALEYVR
jgi:hypothetical protein